MLVARDLEKVYPGVVAVRGASLEALPGTFVALLGRSGSGKSTFLSMLGGLSRPTKGQVLLAGEDLWALSDSQRAARRNRKLGFMFQFHGLHPALTALDNALLPARLAGLPARERALELLTRLGLGQRLWALPGELSGGEQRRVALVRALINRPAVVLADEPTGDLDLENEAGLLEALRRECQAQGSTLVLVTHNPALAVGADQVWEMCSGRLQAARRPQESAAPPVSWSAEVPVLASAERPPDGTPRRWLTRAAALTLGVMLLDGALSFAREGRRQAEEAAHRTLERAAMQRLRADLGAIVKCPGSRYEVELVLDNPFADQPVYVLAPDLTASVQVGFQWQEVPLRPRQARSVLRVVGRQVLRYDLTASVPRFEQVMPGYMHVRFTNMMLVSQAASPNGSEVYRRSDNYYVYLKPEGANEAELARRNNFPGGAPLFIPMPPH